MPKAWSEQLEEMLNKDEKHARGTSSVFISRAQETIHDIQIKLQRLLDSYLDQDIDQQTYKTKQATLMGEKKTLEEQISKLTLSDGAWIEPLRHWLTQAVSLCKIAQQAEPEAMKQAFSKMDGLNLCLADKKVELKTENRDSNPSQTQWTALRTALESTSVRRAGVHSTTLVGMKGLEPSRLAAHAPKACVSTNSTTSPYDLRFAVAGFD